MQLSAKSIIKKREDRLISGNMQNGKQTHIVQDIRPLIILGRPPKIVSNTDNDAEKCETNTGRCGNLPHSGEIYRPHDKRNQEGITREIWECDGQGISSHSFIAYDVLEILGLNSCGQDGCYYWYREGPREIQPAPIRS